MKNFIEIPKNALVYHVRDKAGKPFATVAAIDPENIGISVKRKTDLWCRKFGAQVAVARAIQGSGMKIPNRNKKLLVEAVAKMQERAKKYYKN